MTRLEKQYSLKGLSVVVTGASSALGLAMAITMAECGAFVFGLSRSGNIKVKFGGEIPKNIVFDKMDVTNAVSPGWFPSLMNQQVIAREREKKILGRMPLYRYGEPEELTAMICFLASPAASYITGQDFSVDGGARAYGRGLKHLTFSKESRQVV